MDQFLLICHSNIQFSNVLFYKPANCFSANFRLFIFIQAAEIGCDGLFRAHSFFAMHWNKTQSAQTSVGAGTEIFQVSVLIYRKSLSGLKWPPLRSETHFLLLSSLQNHMQVFDLNWSVEVYSFAIEVSNWLSETLIVKEWYGDCCCRSKKKPELF